MGMKPVSCPAITIVAGRIFREEFGNQFYRRMVTEFVLQLVLNVNDAIHSQTRVRVGIGGASG